MVEKMRIGSAFGAGVTEQLRRADEKSAAAHRLLANYGWYSQPDWLGNAAEYLAGLLEENEREGNQKLCELIDGMVPRISSRLLSEHPSREAIVQEALTLHAGGHFFGSTSLFLQIADGIWEEATGYSIYSRRRRSGLPKTADQGPSVFRSPYRTGLDGLFPLLWGKKDREAAGSDDYLNRHTALHGESVSYGTRENSCRALSYLGYAAWMVTTYKSDEG